MTDKQDIHAEMMELADDYAKSTHNDGIHGLSGVSLITEGAAGRHAALARSVTDRLTQAEQEIVALTLSVSNRDARIAELEAQLEAERLRLAACGVAALMNTRDSTKDRIGKDNPFHSGSYSDVCRAVDREIEYREQLEAVGAGGVGAMVPPVPRLKLTRENIDSAARFAIESDLLPPEEWEAAGLYDFAHAVSGGVSVVDDLATLVRRIAHSLRKAAPGNNLVEHALDYLKRHGLDGFPLRQGDSAAQPAPASKFDAGYFYNLVMHALMDVGAPHGGCKYRLAAQPLTQERKPMTQLEINSMVNSIAHYSGDYEDAIVRTVEKHHGIRPISDGEAIK